MTEHEQRTEIARIRGWTLAPDEMTWLAPGSKLLEGGGIEGYWCAEYLLPEITLDNMREAEAELSPDMLLKYQELLCKLVVTPGSLFKPPTVDTTGVSASKWKRAMAFLMVHDRWNLIKHERGSV